MRPPATIRRGFTLVEMVVAMLVLAALGIGVASWVQFGARIYSDSSERSALLDASRFAVERLSRELRGAIPASIRVAGDGSSLQCIEWLPQQAAGSYLSLPLTAPAASLEVVAIPGYSFGSGDLLLVAALAPAQVYSALSERRAAVAGYSTSGQRATLDLVAATTFAAASPASRFYIGSRPVSYCVSGGSLYRYSGYALATSQPLPPGGGVLMAEQLVNRLNDSSDLPFVQQPATLQREALVQLRLRFAAADGVEPLEYFHVVQTPNVP